MKKRWSPMELHIKGLKILSPSTHIKVQILKHVMKLKMPGVTLIDKLWASRSLRISWITAIIILILLGSFSDWRVSQKMTRLVQEEIDSITDEEDLLAKELGFHHREALQKIRSYPLREKTIQEQVRQFLEKEEFLKEI